MNIVDSSGWLAYFADEPNARHFLPPLLLPICVSNSIIGQIV